MFLIVFFFETNVFQLEFDYFDCLWTKISNINVYVEKEN